MFVKSRPYNCSYFALRRFLLLEESLYVPAVRNTYCYVSRETGLDNYEEGKIYILLSKEKITTEILRKKKEEYVDFEKEYIEKLRNFYWRNSHAEFEFVDWVENEDYILLIMSFADEFNIEVNKFWEGKYSEYSNESKKFLLRNIEDKYDPHPRPSVWSLFFPRMPEKRTIEEMYGVELDYIPETMEKPKVEDETLNIVFVSL